MPEAILARSPGPTAKPVTPTPQLCRSDQDAARLVIGRPQSLLILVIDSLYRRGVNGEVRYDE